MRRARFLFLLAAVVACGGGGTDEGPHVETVEVTSSAPSVPVGGSITLTATARDDAGRVVTGRTTLWSAEPQFPVTLSTTLTGPVTVRGVQEGTATITASVDGKSDQVTITVTPAPVARVEVSGATPLAVGATAQYAARVYDAANNELPGRAVTWSSSNEAVATVSQTGMVTATGEGSAFIRATSGGVTASTTVNVELPTLGGLVSQVVAGRWHSCALVAAEAWCWGLNLRGQLGDGTTTARTVATRVAGGHRFVSLSAGAEHTCGVTDAGGVMCWGNNDQAQLGDGTTTMRMQSTPVVGLPSPVREVVAGVALTCARASSGAAWCWGQNGGGQAGIGEYSAELLRTPTAISGGHSFSNIVLGEEHACGIASGAVLCWGNNIRGQVGDGTNVTRLSPVAVTGALGTVEELVAGGMHTCAISADRIARCWGDNSANQLATLPPNPPQRTAAPIEPASLRFVRLAGGSTAYHTCGVVTGGTMQCWGSNGFGQRGTGDAASPFGATAVQTGGLAFATATAGNYHTCGMTADRRVYCWGSNDQGQLGDGTRTRRLVPTAVKRAP